MIILDTGPLVALFDPKDPDYDACHKILKKVDEPIYSTEAVLTEVLHILAPDSRGAEGVKAFLMGEYFTLKAQSKDDIERCFSLMEKYRDLPMDFADATLVVLAENLKTAKVFTLDLSDFSVYRYKKGHRYYALELVGAELLAI